PCVRVEVCHFFLNWQTWGATPSAWCIAAWLIPTARFATLPTTQGTAPSGLRQAAKRPPSARKLRRRQDGGNHRLVGGPLPQGVHEGAQAAQVGRAAQVRLIITRHEVL